MLSEAGLNVHHHSGMEVLESKVPRMDADVLLFHHGYAPPATVPEINDVASDEGALNLLNATLFFFEVKSAISGRDNAHADQRFIEIKQQIDKHVQVWREIKRAPAKFTIKSRFGEPSPISHFTSARYFVYGVSSPLMNPYVENKFLRSDPPVLPFRLSGTRYVPVGDATTGRPATVIPNGPLSLFFRLKPFLRLW